MEHVIIYDSVLNARLIDANNGGQGIGVVVRGGADPLRRGTRQSVSESVDAVLDENMGALSNRR